MLQEAFPGAPNLSVQTTTGKVDGSVEIQAVTGIRVSAVLFIQPVPRRSLCFYVVGGEHGVQ